jgi:predicted nucleic acid binding AN1-type Zn finger protein
MDDFIPWVECDDCGDYVCNVHEGEHVADCSCPGVETWMTHGMWPYHECDQEAVMRMLESDKATPQND